MFVVVEIKMAFADASALEKIGSTISQDPVPKIVTTLGVVVSASRGKKDEH